MFSEAIWKENAIVIVLAWISFIFWSFLLEFFSMVYFLNLATLSINAGILYLLFLFAPAIFGVNQLKDRSQKFFEYLPFLGIIGFGYFFARNLHLRVMMISLGFLFFYSFLVLEWKHATIEHSQLSAGFVAGLLILLISRFAWFSRNILWKSNVSVTIAIVLTLVVLSARISFPKGSRGEKEQNRNEQTRPIARISSFSAALFFSHLLFSNYSIIPRWVGLDPPISGMIVILALAAGLLLQEARILRSLIGGVLGVIGVTLISYGEGWVGMIGGVLLGILLPALWAAVISTFHEMNLKKEFPIATGIYIFLVMAVIFATVYDYVPLGELFREQEELFLILATAFLYTYYSHNQFSRSMLSDLKKYRPSKQLVATGILIAVLLPVSFGARVYLSNKTLQPQNEIVAMTFNIQQGFDRQGIVNFEKVAEIIEATKANIVGLQETDTLRPTSSGRDVVEWLGWRLGLHYYEGPKTRDSTFGNGLLSAFSIVATETIILPSEGELAVLIKAKISVNEGILNIFVAHFGETEMDRLSQAAKTAQIIKQTTGPLILLGDFNSEPQSVQIKTIIQAGVIDAYATTHNQTHAPTTVDGNSTIDFIFYRGLQIKGSGIVQGYTGSDHRPVYAVFELP